MSDNVSCPGERFTLGGLYASGVDSMTLVATGGEFTLDGLYDSGGDSTTLVTGKYTANYFSHKYGVGCVCMLNDWFSSVAMSCPCGGFKPHGLYELGQCGAYNRKYTTKNSCYKFDVWLSWGAERQYQQCLVKLTSLGLYDSGWDSVTAFAKVNCIVC